MSDDKIKKAWEKYEECYPLLADHYRPPTIYVRGKSLDDKIEITHIPDEEEKPKWKGAPFEVMYPNPFDYPLAPRAEAFWKGKPEVNVKDWLEEHVQDIPSAGECVAFIFKGIDKEIEIARAMTPYNTLAINGFIDNELWWKIYKSLRESFGNEK